jgi:hypothetical protein
LLSPEVILTLSLFYNTKWINPLTLLRRLLNTDGKKCFFRPSYTDELNTKQFVEKAVCFIKPDYKSLEWKILEQEIRARGRKSLKSGK